MPVTINGTSGVVSPDGSAGTPAYQGSDANTGMFFPAADTIAFAEGGVEVMRIDSSGNVGIGTSSPNTYGGQLANYKTTGVGTYLGYSNSGTFPKVSAIGLGSDGVGFTHTSGGSTFTLSGSVQIAAIQSASSNAPTDLAFYTTSNGSVTERARIDSSGNFSITQTPGRYTVDVTGGATSIANGGTVDFSNASGMLVVNNHSNGGVTIYLCGGGSVTTTSSVIGTVGSFAYVGGINGYRWTNNFGSTATFGFFFVRTRPNA